MSLWPILYPRRQDSEQLPMPTPADIEPYRPAESDSAAGFQHSVEMILRQTLEVTGAGSAGIPGGRR